MPDPLVGPATKAARRTETAQAPLRKQSLDLLAGPGLLTRQAASHLTSGVTTQVLLMFPGGVRCDFPRGSKRAAHQKK